jgi:hypothetical protein
MASVTRLGLYEIVARMTLVQNWSAQPEQQ